MGPSQLNLFTGLPERGPRVAAAPTSPAATQLSLDLPEGIRLGTSSWSFPGWASTVYDRDYSVTKLARHGLQAYRTHPLFRCVGVDRTFYGPLTPDVFRSYADQVPNHFRFLVKAHEYCTTAQFGDHPRYGRHAGQSNPHYLDPEYATDFVVAPAVEGLKHHLGAVLFQFPPHPADLLGGRTFARRLSAFLGQLPQGPCYAIELRTRELFDRSYLQAIQEVGAIHCILAHPRMPTPGVQWIRCAETEFRATIIRWMLHRKHRHRSAESAYAPYDRLVDNDAKSRDQLAQICLDSTRDKRPVLAIVSNNAEGCAPLSVDRLAKAIVQRTR